MRLTSLSMKNFCPFADGEITFPAMEKREDQAEVHLFTGENGTGKTRVLAALMASLGNLNELQDRVRQDSGTELRVEARSRWVEEHSHDTGGVLGWTYFDGGQSPRTAHFAEQISDRIGTALREDGAAPSPAERDGWALAGTGAALLTEAKITLGAPSLTTTASDTLTLQQPSGGPAAFQRLVNLRMGVALERDRNAESTKRLSSSLAELEKTIGRITGREFSIQIKQGREHRLVFYWGGVELFFSELPDGLRSLLNWLAGWVVLQVEHFEASEKPLKEPVVLILDQPENHIHPAWQRRVLPEVQRLFPNAQMFVVTHSPFVVCSLNRGWIHRFVRNSSGQVKVRQATEARQGDTYVDAVQDVLGLQAIERFDPESEELLENFQALLRRVDRGKAALADLEPEAESLRKRGGEVASIVESEMYQLAASARK